MAPGLSGWSTQYTQIRILVYEDKTGSLGWIVQKGLRSFPQPVRRDMGQALYAAQSGEEYPSVKALQGFGGRAVLEIVAPHEGDTYRAVYTVRFYDANLRVARVSEEVEERHRDASKRN